MAIPPPPKKKGGVYEVTETSNRNDEQDYIFRRYVVRNGIVIRSKNGGMLRIPVSSLNGKKG